MVDGPSGEASNLAEQQQNPAMAPRLVHASAASVFKLFSTTSGATTVDAVYLKGEDVRRNGEHGEETVSEITVWTPEDFATYAKTKEEEDYALDDEASGRHSFKIVPIFPAYTNQTGFMTGTPPYEDLAWVNLAHWQSSSDYRNNLRISQVPIPYEAGTPVSEDPKAPFVISASHVHRSQSPNYKIGFAETSGNALRAGREDLTDLEAKMMLLGMRPFVERTGNQTATARALDEANVQCDVQAWVRGLERTLEAAITLAAESMNEKLPDDFSVDVFQDFAVSMKAVENFKALTEARKLGDIDRRTYLEESRRLGFLDEETDIEELLMAVEQEQRDAAAMFGTPGLDEDDDDDDTDGGEGEEPEASDENE